MWDVVGDVREDIFGGIHAIQELIIRQHINDGLPLRQDWRHLQQLLRLFFGQVDCLGSQETLITTPPGEGRRRATVDSPAAVAHPS